LTKSTFWHLLKDEIGSLNDYFYLFFVLLPEFLIQEKKLQLELHFKILLVLYSQDLSFTLTLQEFLSD